MVQQRYRGNQNLHSKNTNIAFSEDQVKEYTRCMNDPNYFIEKYVKIINIDNHQVIPFEIRDYQRDLLNTIHKNRFTIVKFPRQAGKTTTVASYALHAALFNSNYSILIAANKNKTALDTMRRIKKSFENLPEWLQENIIKWNEGEIEFESGSRIVSVATASDSARGFAFNCVILDEFAFVEQSIAEEFYSSTYPTISSGKNSKFVIVSTPNGFNHYHAHWIKAINKRSEYKAMEIAWNAVPGRDDRFKRQTIANLGMDFWLREYSGEFIGSSATLIAPSILKAKIGAFEDPYQISERVRFFKKVEDAHTYFLSVDTSEGKEQDSNAFAVIDITERPFNAVCTFSDNSLNPLLFPEVIHRVARYYNDAYVLVETKTTGIQIADGLFKDLEYPNILGAETRGRKGQVLTTYSDKSKGLSTSKVTKAIGCSNLKLLVENDQLMITDLSTLDQLASFVRSRDSFAADSGKSDDLVMVLVNFAWATTQAYFSHITEVNIKLSFEDKIRHIQEALPAVGIRVDDADDFILYEGQYGTIDNFRFNGPHW
jgi:hypothetical protein